MLEKAESLLQEEKKSLSSFDSKTRKFSEQKDLKKRQLKENELQCSRLEKELQIFTAEKGEMNLRIKDTLKKYPWVKEKKYGTPF